MILGTWDNTICKPRRHLMGLIWLYALLTIVMCFRYRLEGVIGGLTNLNVQVFQNFTLHKRRPYDCRENMFCATLISCVCLYGSKCTRIVCQCAGVSSRSHRPMQCRCHQSHLSCIRIPADGNWSWTPSSIFNYSAILISLWPQWRWRWRSYLWDLICVATRPCPDLVQPIWCNIILILWIFVFLYKFW